MEETLACIGLGSNQGDSESHIDTALNSLAQIEGCRLDKISQYYQTSPWGLEDQPTFLNAACGLWCQISASDLLSQLQLIETEHGRARTTKWGPRTLDLDIICFGHEKISTPELMIPHPFFKQRRFVLEPLAEIYPDVLIGGKTVEEHLSKCIASDAQRQAQQQ